MKIPTQLKPATILLIFLFSVVFISEGQQSKTYIIGGASLPDLLHVGIGISLNENIALNLKTGTAFQGNWRTYSLGTDLSFYLGKESKKHGVKLWAINSGFTYLKDEGAGKIWKYFFFDNSLSYDFYISRKLVFQPEIGLIFELSKSIKEKPDYESGWFSNFDIDMPIIPLVGARFKIFI